MTAIRPAVPDTREAILGRIHRLENDATAILERFIELYDHRDNSPQIAEIRSLLELHRNRIARLRLFAECEVVS